MLSLPERASSQINIAHCFIWSRQNSHLRAALPASAGRARKLFPESPRRTHKTDVQIKKKCIYVSVDFIFFLNILITVILFFSETLRAPQRQAPFKEM